MRKRAPESKKLPKIVKGMKVECLTDIVNGKIPEWHVGRIVRVGKLGFELFLPRTGNRLYRCRSADFEKTWRLPRRRSRPAAVKAAPKIPKVVPDMAIEVRAHDRWHRAVIREVFPRGRFRFGGGEIIGTRRRADFGTTWRLPQKAVGPATAPKLGDVVEFRGKAFPWRPFEVTRAPDARGFFEAKDQQTGKREWRSVRTVGQSWRWPEKAAGLQIAVGAEIECYTLPPGVSMGALSWQKCRVSTLLNPDGCFRAQLSNSDRQLICYLDQRGDNWRFPGDPCPHLYQARRKDGSLYCTHPSCLATLEPAPAPATPPAESPPARVRAPAVGDRVEIRFFSAARQVESWKEATVTTPPNTAGFFQAEWQESPLGRVRRSIRRVPGPGWRWPTNPPAPEPKPVRAIRTFACDHRSTPGYHNLCVRGAYKDLEIVKGAIEALHERSRVPAFSMAGALREAMVEEIERDAAFFEAAALLFAGLEPPKEVE